LHEIKLDGFGTAARIDHGRTKVVIASAISFSPPDWIVGQRSVVSKTEMFGAAVVMCIFASDWVIPVAVRGR
jgi:hypothetical protein